jgi:hypothetical protein
MNGSSKNGGGILSYALTDFWEEHGSKELKGIFMSPAPLFPIIGLYFWFVLFFGPRFMSGRKPFEISSWMKCYNITNIIANFILCTWTFYLTTFTYDCWKCRYFNPEVPIIYNITIGFSYTALKIFDLLDTVFFVLRKKWNQITPLHVIHHSIMPFTAYVTMKTAFGPAPALTVILNTFVHTIMYYYYHLASQGYNVWWKKYITVIQLIQFYILLVHGVHTFFYPICSYPRLIALLQVVESTYFIFSFTNFYIKAYEADTKSKPVRPDDEQKSLSEEKNM